MIILNCCSSNSSSTHCQMRGLHVFISDIRNCDSKEAEVRRINKELANIRSKFKGDKTLTSQQKKKYVCKLLFTFLLGYDVDFGAKEAVNLLCSGYFSEQQVVREVLLLYAYFIKRAICLYPSCRSKTTHL